jgi:hypothetical protein
MEVTSGDWRRNENRNTKIEIRREKDLTQRAQGSEHRVHREEANREQ